LTSTSSVDATQVWVFAEQEEGKLADVSLELLAKAKELASDLGGEVASVLLGHSVESLAATLFSYGAHVVYMVDDPALEAYRTQPYARAICNLVKKHNPEVVLYGASVIGRDLAPRVASELLTGLTADCTDLRIGEYVDKKSGRKYEKILYQIRPAFGGNIIATIVSPDHRPQMATVREGVVPMPKEEAGRDGRLIREKVDFSPDELVVEVLERYREPKEVDLKSARIIVAGGMGVGDEEGFELIRELADVLGGAVGASRAAVDAGFISKAHQVGQTGTTVRPVLYIACGISGSVQHRAGMQESANIVAVNTDPCAPIFQVAHYAICGDLNVVIPMMIDSYKSRGC